MQTLNMNAFLSRQEEEGYEGSELAKCLTRLPEPTPQGPWLCGGAVRRTVQGTPVAASDFDFFFASKEQFAEFDKALTSCGAYSVATNEKNTTYILPESDDGDGKRLPKLKIQAITIAYFASIGDVLDSFDYTICQFGFDGEILYCGDYSLWDLGRNRLVPHRISYGVSSLRRMLKYTGQGFGICAGGLGEILEQVVRTPDIIRAETQYID